MCAQRRQAISIAYETVLVHGPFFANREQETFLIKRLKKHKKSLTFCVECV